MAAKLLFFSRPMKLFSVVVFKCHFFFTITCMFSVSFVLISILFYFFNKRLTQFFEVFVPINVYEVILETF